MRRRPILVLVLLGLLSSVIGIAAALLIPWFPEAASEEADTVDFLYYLSLSVAMPIFVLVMAIAIYSVIAFRARPGDMRDGAPIHGNARLEVFWITVPFLIVIALMVPTAILLAEMEEPAPEGEGMVVEVRGEQFAWSFAYPQEDGPPVRSPDLMLPIDRQIEFRVETEDVLHSFWIPEFRLKTDAVPGTTTTVRMTPNQEGEFNIVCAELCGIGHSTMRQAVTVLSEDDFSAWIGEREQALAGEEGDGELPPEQSPSGVAGQAAEQATSEEEEGGGDGAE